jgi:hypothetical protein
MNMFASVANLFGIISEHRENTPSTAFPEPFAVYVTDALGNPSVGNGNFQHREWCQWRICK